MVKATSKEIVIIDAAPSVPHVGGLQGVAELLRRRVRQSAGGHVKTAAAHETAE
jgi:hypothetical protein